jgi:hypothetical protein
VIALIILATLVSGVPQYDIDKMCKRETTITNDASSVGGCAQDEKASKDRLEKAWSHYPAAAKQECVSGSTEGLGPSYIEIETCFQMQDWKNHLDDVGGSHVPGAHGPQLP